MKSIRNIAISILVLALLLPAAALIPATASAEVIPAGTISYWGFDEGSGTTAFDPVGTNNIH
ncbi:hypothetical protein ACFLTS_07440 [Chloroflexota bacterium]